jgi:transcriptional/translational regulatory protein YebC/TACO1
MFDKKGYIVVEKRQGRRRHADGAALEAGADDMRDDGDNWEIITTRRRSRRCARR